MGVNDKGSIYLDSTESQAVGKTGQQYKFVQLTKEYGVEW